MMSYVNLYITAEDLTSDFFQSIPFEECDGNYIVLDDREAYVNVMAVDNAIKKGKIDLVLWPRKPDTATKLARSLFYDSIRHPDTTLVDDKSEFTGNEDYEWWIYGKGGEAVRAAE